MRALILALAAVIVLAAAPAARAAPTCQDSAGETVRCATAGAMPVGWSPPTTVDRRASQGRAPSLNQLLSLLCVVGGLFALIALMPKFDGEWDEQEGGGDEPG